MIRAVIFDMDGLLTDSEAPGLTGIQVCGRLQGYEIPLEHVRRTIGINAKAASDFYHQYYPGLDTDRLFADFTEYMHALAREGKIPLKKGARELLRALRDRGIPCAVASSSYPETIRLYLEKQGIADDFAALVSANGETRSKPAPDIFLKAAGLLGAAPENCLVLEDSVNGVKAGRAAGMTVCMIPDLIPFTPELAPYCDHVLPDLSAVIPLVTA